MITPRRRTRPETIAAVVIATGVILILVATILSATGVPGFAGPKPWPTSTATRAPIYVEGDSIIAGISPLTEDQKFHGRLMARLPGTLVYNRADPGACIVAVGCYHPQTMLDEWPTIRDAQPKPAIIIFNGGRNDLGWIDTDSIKAAIVLYRDNVTAAGYRFIIGTIIPPRWSWLYNFPTCPSGSECALRQATEVQRLDINTWIRTSGLFDRVVDFDAALRGADGTLPVAYSLDELHPNATGTQIMANTVPAGWLAP